MTLEERLRIFRNSRNKQEFLTYFTEHPKEIPALIKLVTQLTPYPIKEYASWFLIHLAKHRSGLVKPYYGELVDVCFRTENQSVLRNVCCCLNELKIDVHRDIEFVDRLLSYIQDSSNKVAVQVYSIYLLIQFAEKYPELTEEFRKTIDFNSRNKTAAYLVAQRNFHRAYPKK